MAEDIYEDGIYKGRREDNGDYYDKDGLYDGYDNDMDDRYNRDGIYQGKVDEDE